MFFNATHTHTHTLNPHKRKKIMTRKTKNNYKIFLVHHIQQDMHISNHFMPSKAIKTLKPQTIISNSLREEKKKRRD